MFLSKVASTINKHRMIRRGETVLAAVSGGPDSMALLAALLALKNQLNFKLRAAYVNHGLRPAAAKKEAAFVRGVCRRWGVPVYVAARTVSARSGESLESAARRVRYDALLHLAVRCKADVIALGHTADDQAETVLMWLLRGTGMTGLAGMPPVRPMFEGGRKNRSRVVRPLIHCLRSEGQKFLSGHGVKPMLDRSNQSGRFLRNRIRKELLPLIERRYSPAFRRHLIQVAEIARSNLHWIDMEARALFSECAKVGRGRVRLDRNAMREAPPVLRQAVMRMAVERLQGNCHGFSWSHWAKLEELSVDGRCAGQDFPHGFRAEISDGKSFVLRRKML